MSLRPRLLVSNSSLYTTNVQNLGFLGKTRDSRKKCWKLLKLLKAASLTQNATEIVRFLETCKLQSSFKKQKFFEKKISNFLKFRKFNKVAIECDWNREKSLNAQNLRFLGKKDGFLEKKFQNP